MGMSSIQWCSGYEVWLPEFDAEHKQIVQLAEQVRVAAGYGALPVIFEPLLQDLARHLRAHFANEEKQMRSGRYPLFAWHKSLHDAVRRKLDAMSTDREAVPAFLEFLSAWVRDHTGVADRMMASYLRNRMRVTPAARRPPPESPQRRQPRRRSGTGSGVR